MSDPSRVLMYDEEGYVHSVLLAQPTVDLAYKLGLMPANSAEMDKLEAWEAAAHER